jgi:hypothetical protein
VGAQWLPPVRWLGVQFRDIGCLGEHLLGIVDLAHDLSRRQIDTEVRLRRR